MKFPRSSNDRLLGCIDDGRRQHPDQSDPRPESADRFAGLLNRNPPRRNREIYPVISGRNSPFSGFLDQGGKDRNSWFFESFDELETLRVGASRPTSARFRERRTRRDGPGGSG
jgi:hypothetical protein